MMMMIINYKTGKLIGPHKKISLRTVGLIKIFQVQLCRQMDITYHMRRPCHSSSKITA